METFLDGMDRFYQVSSVLDSSQPNGRDVGLRRGGDLQCPTICKSQVISDRPSLIVQWTNLLLRCSTNYFFFFFFFLINAEIVNTENDGRSP